ncbi:hypothetical protein SELMODRAFT_141980 [Selaginella moellendorffii]|uniref:Uncharacterized protein RPT2C-1 n=1 Tax=Selaginella moellendorffii TaxID=88036 RepID=D8QX13_SELML|nr:BTB/POZ domain-containing protein At5g48800 [Selaginella moellendorffii]EFJ35735.1 hypothetical protein SELMODRAFT_141980 [Selaginella moellendorffii]|eukprot:XP_002963864.1 BTB/POZ domain-containing protein At5g48800 [Selaginella moellendorffii]
MVGVMPKQESKRLVSRTSYNKKRTGQWIMSADVPTDVVVEAAGTSFSLHKFPLVARCGRIRRAVAEAREMDLSRIEFPDVPGGAETFELAAKFCYGINFEITTANVAALRCAAEYLEMKDEYGQGNLLGRTEAFVNEVVLPSFANSLCVLHSCEELLPIAEDNNLVSRCIDAIASIACKDQKPASSLSGSDYGSSGRLGSKGKPNATLPKSAFTEWWAEDLSLLRIDFYQRVLEAMKSKGVREESLWGTLMHYAQQSLKGLNRAPTGGRGLMKVQENTAALEHEQRILVETIVSLLPREKNIASCSFLFGLLRTAIILDTTVACRLDIEKRIALQLDQATLDDLLVPSFSYNGETLFDVDIVQRILTNFIQQHENDDLPEAQTTYESDGLATPTQTSVSKVAKLMDGYLAEIAPDANLKVNKFVAIGELLPDYARAIDDGLYRAVDIYLKAHPNLGEQERKKICRLLSAQKLSQEACCHAAQNERLPAHFAIQVLYFEQVRIRTEMGSTLFMDDPNLSHFSGGRGGPSGTVSAAMSPRDNYSSLRRENRELKLEIARMRMRLSELEKSHNNMKQDIEKTTSSAKLAQTVSRRLHRLNPFSRRSSKESDSFSKASEGSHSQKPSRDRRHSYS